MGPFGGGVVQVLLPVLQQWYGVSLEVAALSVSAYMVPFAGAQFFSGAIADRLGRKPVLVAGFAGFAVASAWGATAPTFGGFLAARAGQGLANAFTTPILMATLGDAVEPQRLGRALGWFGAVNTAGLFLAPLVAGILGALDWRLVYVVLALASVVLTVVYVGLPQGGNRVKAAAALTLTLSQRKRGLSAVLTPRLGALCLAALLGYLSLNGAGFLVVLHGVDAFGLNVAQSGVLLSLFGLANMLAAAPAGMAVDRLGGITVSAVGAIAAATVLALLAVAPGPMIIGALLLIGGVAVAGLWAGLTKLAVQAFSERRATAISIFNAWKFVGYALAPVVYTPIYTGVGAQTAFVAAAGATALILAPLAFVAIAGREPQVST